MSRDKSRDIQIRYARVRVYLQKEKYLEISRRFYIESKYNTTINNSMLQGVRRALRAARDTRSVNGPRGTCGCAKHVYMSHKPLTHIGSKIRGKSNFNQFPLLYKSSSSRITLCDVTSRDVSPRDKTSQNNEELAGKVRAKRFLQKQNPSNSFSRFHSFNSIDKSSY